MGNDIHRGAGGGGGGAPTAAQYVVLAVDAGLSAERVLTAGENVKLTDGGANGNATVDVLTEDVQLTGDITPTALAADQDDWNPTNLATASVIRASSTTDPVSIRGLQGGADGRLIIIHNVGAVPLVLQHEATTSTAGNRFALGENLILFENQCVILQYDSTSSRWRSLTGGSFLQPNPFRRALMFEDWITGQGLLGSYSWSTTVSGTGASSQTPSTYGVDATQKVCGAIQSDTGTTTTGRAGMHSPVAGIVPALGVCFVAFRVVAEALSTAGEEFIISCGLGDHFGAAGDAVDGVYFEYDRLTAGDFWRTVTSQASTRTKNTTNVAVTTGYIWLGFIINAAWTRVWFFTSTTGETWTPTNTGAHTANIPSGSQLTGLGHKIEKSAGTTQRNLSEDARILDYEYRRGT